jgi:hypothetical protein
MVHSLVAGDDVLNSHDADDVPTHIDPARLIIDLPIFMGCMHVMLEGDRLQFGMKWASGSSDVRESATA